jgi:hypothetical protein
MTCARAIPPASQPYLVHNLERELYELALELRRVPVVEKSRRVHVRALELKREIMRAGADEEALRSARDEIGRLRAEAIRLRRQLLTSDQARVA